MQPAGQRREQPLAGEGQRLGMFDAGRQFDMAAEAFGKHERHLRVGQLAPGAQQVIDRPAADTPAQACPRQEAQIAETLEAERLQALHRRVRPAGNAAGQDGQGCLHGRCIPADFTGAGLRQPARTERRRGDGPAGGITLSGATAEHRLDDDLDPAEQAQATADFQQQPGRRRQAQRRRKPPGPARQAFQRPALARRIALEDRQPGLQAERRRQLLPGADSGFASPPVAHQHPPAADDSARRLPQR